MTISALLGPGFAAEAVGGFKEHAAGVYTTSVTNVLAREKAPGPYRFPFQTAFRGTEWIPRQLAGAAVSLSLDVSSDTKGTPRETPIMGSSMLA